MNISSRTPVDIIVPSYNMAPWLKFTLEGLLAQTHRAIIIYVIDDGSTDKGATKRYVQSLKDPRVKYVHKENGGLAAARNTGIAISSSPLVAFCDADDVWYKDKLALQVKLLAKKPRLGLVYGSHDYIDEKNQKTGGLNAELRGNAFEKLLSGNRITGSGSMVLVPRRVLDKVGFFHEDFRIGEDWEFWLRIAQKYSIDFVDKRIVAIRMRSDSMQTNNLKMADGLMYMLPVMIRELQLNRKQRALMKSSIYWQAAVFYFWGGRALKARSLLVKLFAIDPHALRDESRQLGYLLVMTGHRPATFLSRALRKISPKTHQRLVDKS